MALTLPVTIMRTRHADDARSAHFRRSAGPNSRFCGDVRVCTWARSTGSTEGTLPHRALGWLWVLLMTVVAVSAFFIHALKIWGIWSPIHLLAIFTLLMLPLAVWRARTHRVTGHKRAMLGLFFGALVIAGVFTLLPGRIIHDVVFTR
jgi:uncharacterized membrane protein